MHRTKPSRARLLVPSALAVLILSGAAAPAVAADGAGSAELTKRVAAVQQKIETIEGRAAAGPIDDLLAGLSKTIADLLKSLEGLLPAGVKIPPIVLPKLPELPAVPGLPSIPVPPVEVPALPPVGGVPALPPVGGVPALPPVGGAPALPTDLVPDLPAIPGIPDLP
ncbi:hypothetical protein [Streptomyces sp. H27-S2]|uniref:hypothetical protein n=1 Tax=Streptomyces antarcticus TaxID=2996458 RepID=UPI002270EE2C|nr:hypothetical protein [Streptomyces sp. H27-S2]MCY0951761.1 hypothetical protein [Streptomyces sp. H27-S2]